MKNFAFLPLVLMLFILSCSEPPLAQFSAEPTSIIEGEAVTFTDESSNFPSSWLWDFGDGGTSAEQNPTHTYDSEGLYSVSLTATNEDGANDVDKPDYIEVGCYCVTDFDGNVYEIVDIGDQTWMAENLATTSFNDGGQIPAVPDSTEWFKLTTPGYCWYENDPVTYKPAGALYNWYTVESEKLCPTGWRVPSDEEWMALEQYLGMSAADAQSGDHRGTDEGKKLKSMSGWDNNGNGTDEYQFSALPTGVRTNQFSPQFIAYGFVYAVWTSTSNSNYVANMRQIRADKDDIGKYDVLKGEGLAVRCIKD